MTMHGLAVMRSTPPGDLDHWLRRRRRRPPRGNQWCHGLIAPMAEHCMVSFIDSPLNLRQQNGSWQTCTICLLTIAADAAGGSVLLRGDVACKRGGPSDH
jgi:hypothetical protein